MDRLIQRARNELERTTDDKRAYELLILLSHLKDDLINTLYKQLTTLKLEQKYSRVRQGSKSGPPWGDEGDAG